MIAPLRAAALIALVLIGIPLQWLALKFGRGGFIPHLYHRAACGLLGMKLEQVGALAAQRPLLLVSNHSSWLDITVLAAAMPVSFVAKSEVGAWPGIGFLARLSRTIFVDRKRRSTTGGATREIGERLATGEAVVLFAEGTSSDHNRVLPFRSALIGAAREAIAGGGGEQVYVQPVSVAYPRRHGLPVLRRERPQIAWYGGMTLPKHLWELMKQGGPDAVISFGEPIRVTAETDRKLVAQRAENEVRVMTRRALRGPSAPAPILLEAQTG